MNSITPTEKYPLVSIVITTYNHGKFIKDAIESALAQTYSNIEVLVVDDGSTDNTKEIVLNYSNVIYHYKENNGLSAARNTGIQLSSGEFVLFLDADDYLYSNGIEINLQYLLPNENLAFVSGSYKYVDINKNENQFKSVQIVGNHYHRLLITNYIGMHATVLYRKSIIEKYYFNTTLKCAEDYDVYLRITSDYNVVHHTKFIAAYRRLSNSMSSNIPLMLYTTLKVLKINSNNQIDKKRIAALYEIGRNNWIEFFCNIAKKKLVEKEVKKFSKIWFKTVVLILQFHFISTIKFFLKKLKKSFNTFTSTKKNKNTDNTFSVFVLMYHKIYNPDLDVWNLCVSKDNFEAHLKYLKDTNAVIDTKELLSILNGKKKLNKNQVYITFDDGYEDNALIAAPLLEAYQIPATFFITNKTLLQNSKYFWWDILEIIFLRQLNLPTSLILNTEYLSFEIHFGDESNLPYIEIETLLWKGIEFVNKRTEAYSKIWHLLIGLVPSEQDEIISQLLLWSNVDLSQYDSYNIMDTDMLINLKNNQFIEIGGHTKNHVSLGQMDKNIQDIEIQQNKIDLEKLLKRELNMFAYPYGRYNMDTADILINLGYTAAFTCEVHSINNFSNKMKLGRYQVMNQDETELDKMLTKAGFYYS